MTVLRLRPALLAASLLVPTSGVAVAQNTATFDPAQLPAIQGKVAEYSLTPRGDVDGLILQNGMEVHLPPHLGTQLVYAVKPGDAVTVHGLKALAIPMVQAMSVTNDMTGQTVIDTVLPGAGPRGPGGPGVPGQPLTAQGTIKMQLYGPRGELNGVMLDDGTEIHLPPPEAARLATWLAPGQSIYAQGLGLASPLGRVVGAQFIGPSQAQAVAVATPPPPRGLRGPRPGPWATASGSPPGAASPPPTRGAAPPPPAAEAAGPLAAPPGPPSPRP